MSYFKTAKLHHHKDLSTELCVETSALIFPVGTLRFKIQTTESQTTLFSSFVKSMIPKEESRNHQGFRVTGRHSVFYSLVTSVTSNLQHRQLCNSAKSWSSLKNFLTWQILPVPVWSRNSTSLSYSERGLLKSQSAEGHLTASFEWEKQLYTKMSWSHASVPQTTKTTASDGSFVSPIQAVITSDQDQKTRTMPSGSAI